MSISALLLAIGLNTDSQPLSVFAILSFVAAFSVGLGPVTWVVLPEVMPAHAVTAAGSVGLALNWSLNFAISALFVPVQQYLAGEDGRGEGNVFYVFMALCAVGFMGIWMGYRARERV
jgi:MFS family permease